MPKPVQFLLGFVFGPIFWGIAFLAPLMAALMVQMEISPPAGLSEIQLTLILGALWGTYAKIRGAWL